MSNIDKMEGAGNAGEQANCEGVGSTTVNSLLLNLAVAGGASAPSPGRGYKALVCLFLDGGNDSFNMLVPTEPGEFARYRAARGDLALPREGLLGLRGAAGADAARSFGLHPSLPRVRDLHDQGRLSFVCNVGTLVEPTDLAGLNGARARLPLGLYSHADQVMHWQTSIPDSRASVGWAGRAAEILQSMNRDNGISMNVSLSGTNVFQSGRSLVPYSITPDGAALLDGYSDPARPFFAKAVDSLLGQRYPNVLKQAYAGLTRDSIKSAGYFLDAWRRAPRVATAFPGTRLGKSLRGVAQGIAARDNLGARRQTYFVKAPGWDHHDEVLASQAAMLADVDASVAAFWTAMGELGLQDDVLLFTASDFGRTLSSNGKGSDHGWGGNQFILGGAHRGGRLYGSYPDDLSLGNGLDTGRGRLIPTLSVDAFFCELALWLGVGKGDIPAVLPNIGRFHDLNGAAAPLGFLN